MHLKLTSGFGLAVALTIWASNSSTAVGDGIFPFHLHQGHGQQGDCEAKQTVVRLPAQEIRVETAAPRVVVGAAAVGHHRVRGYAPLAAGFVPFAPVAAGPFVATFVPAGGLTFGAPQVGSPALDAIHTLERQHLEFVKHKAALKAEMDHVEAAYKRVHAGLAAPVGDSSSLQKSLDDLTKRVSDIERLLVIHDNVLQEKFGKQPK